MPREASIPLFLWVSSALVFHLGFSGGAEGVTRAVEAIDRERADIVDLVRGVRGGIRGASTTEGDFEIDEVKADIVEEKVVVDDPNAESTDDVPEATKPKPEPPKPLEVAKVEPPKPPEPEPPKPEPPKEEPKKEVPLKAEVIETKPDERISIKQHAEKNQPDNPDARRLAKDANTVAEETMARLRNLQRDDAEPQPASASGAAGTEGNAERELIKQMEDRKGDDRRAPGEAAKGATATERSAAQRAAESQGKAGGPAAGAAAPPSEASKGSVGGSGTPSPEAATADRGTWSLDPTTLGGTGGGNASGPKKQTKLFVPNVRIFGFGVGAGDDGPPNLGAGTLEASVGVEQLEKERAAFGASIRTQHRGRFDTNKFQRFKAAIENYDPAVKLGNETALNAAASPFAEYLHHMHTRIHPIYGDEFLASGMAAAAGLKDMQMMTAVEIILNPKDGSVIGTPGVVKRSGSTILDAVAIDAVMRAAPFGEAPSEIVSPDGKIYLHWEFHRDPVDACSTKNARPKLLKKIPGKKVPVDAPKPPKPPREEKAPQKSGESAKGVTKQPAR